MVKTLKKKQHSILGLNISNYYIPNNYNFYEVLEQTNMKQYSAF